jgi:hypothetical protein
MSLTLISISHLSSPPLIANVESYFDICDLFESDSDDDKFDDDYTDNSDENCE